MMTELDAWDTDDGLWHVRIVSDPDTEPGDFDSYDIDQARRWRLGLWQFVGVEVAPVVEDRTLDSCAASLWACEWGALADGVDVGRETVGQWIGGLQVECVARMQELTRGLVRVLAEADAARSGVAVDEAEWAIRRQLRKYHHSKGDGS